MQRFEILICCGVLCSFPLCVKEWNRFDLLVATALVALARVVMDAFSTYKDYHLLKPYWEEEGVEHERPLTKLSLPGCEDIDTTDFFRHSSVGGDGILR